MAKGEKKDLMELGQKSRSGRVLSEYLRGIASEKTEIIRDPATGRSVVVTKAEALARKIWERAMGYRVNEETGEVTQGEINLDYVKLVLDRVEGKTGVNDEATDAGKPTAADRVSEINKRRLNSIAEGEEE